MAKFFLCPRKLAAAAVVVEVNFLASPEATDGILAQAGIPKFRISHLLSHLGQEVKGISERDAHRYVVPSRQEVLAAFREMRTGLSGLKNLATERLIKALEKPKNNNKKKAV